VSILPFLKEGLALANTGNELCRPLRQEVDVQEGVEEDSNDFDIARGFFDFPLVGNFCNPKREELDAAEGMHDDAVFEDAAEAIFAGRSHVEGVVATPAAIAGGGRFGIGASAAKGVSFGSPGLVLGDFHELDCVFQDPRTGGQVFVGGISAASNRATLAQHRITRVINCQDAKSENFFEGDSTLHYMRFSVATWFRAPGMDTPAGVLQFFEPVFRWVDDAMSKGEVVLIHCLAGAHRAGTTGIATVMHLTGQPYQVALLETKRKRPVIEPILSLGNLLERLDAALRPATTPTKILAPGGPRTVVQQRPQHPFGSVSPFGTPSPMRGQPGMLWQ